MIHDIHRKYEKFSDALITSVRYDNGPPGSRNAEVQIKCMNSERDYEWEMVRLLFENVVFFRFADSERFSGTVINAALISTIDDMVTVDFFPIIGGTSGLTENVNSDFIIKCGGLTYESSIL